MCFFDQYRFTCGDCKWGYFRQQCHREYRTGKTCGLKLILHTFDSPHKCEICERIDSKRDRRTQKRDQLQRWADGRNISGATIEKIEQNINDLDTEIHGLEYERDERQIGATAPWTCWLCPNYFIRLRDLARHDTTHHRRDEKLNCPKPGCHRIGDDGFYRKDHLIYHMRQNHRSFLGNEESETDSERKLQPLPELQATIPSTGAPTTKAARPWQVVDSKRKLHFRGQISDSEKARLFLKSTSSREESKTSQRGLLNKDDSWSVGPENPQRVTGGSFMLDGSNLQPAQGDSVEKKWLTATQSIRKAQNRAA
jgi:hypothetical protein